MLSSNNSPLISIILPFFNGDEFLESSIQSCLDQTYTNLELILVDDCSTDSSLAIAKKFHGQDKRIKLIENKKNLNLPSSLNIGHYYSRGQFITWTSDDNILLPKMIENHLEALVSSGADVVYGNCKVIDESNKTVGMLYAKSPHQLIIKNVIGASFLYTESFYKKNKGYQEHLFGLEDYDFWLRGITYGKFVHLNLNDYLYRQHPGSLSAMINLEDERKSIFKKQLKECYSNFLSLVDYRGNEREELLNLLVGSHLNSYFDFTMLLKNPNLMKWILVLYREIFSEDYEKAIKEFYEDYINFLLKKESKILSSEIFKTLLTFPLWCHLKINKPKKILSLIKKIIVR